MFTETIKPKVFEQVMNVFADPTTVDARYALEGTTAQVMLQQQTARFQNRRLENGDCQGITVWWYDAGAGSSGYEGSTVENSGVCDPPTSTEGQTKSEDYTHNIQFNGHKKLNSERCDNLLSYSQEMGRVLYDLMYERRQSLNKYIINQMVANAQTNQTPSGQMPTGFTNDATPGSAIVNIASANMSGDEVWPTLVKLNNIALQNRLNRPLVFNGYNFNITAQLANRNRLNDNQRSQGQFFSRGDLAGNFFWDVHPDVGIDTITGAQSSLAVNPNAYAFWNYSVYPDVPQLVDSSKNHWQFSMMDPVFSYRYQGEQRPLIYDVDRWATCTGQTPSGRLLFEETIKVSLRGGFKFAPAGFLRDGATQGYTGVMHFTVI